MANLQVNNFNTSLTTKLTRIWVRKHQDTTNLAKKKTQLVFHHLLPQRPKVAKGANTPPWDRKYFAPIHYVIDRSVSTQDYTKHLIKELFFFFFLFRKLFQEIDLECSIGDRGLPLTKEETLFRFAWGFSWFFFFFFSFQRQGRNPHWLN